MVKQTLTTMNRKIIIITSIIEVAMRGDNR
jgi:hypothetical protein